jgi:hypothetical protein
MKDIEREKNKSDKSLSEIEKNLTEQRMFGLNRFDPDIQYDCPEEQRNLFFKDILKVELEIREQQRHDKRFGTVISETQRDIIQALLLHKNLFINSYCFEERIISILVYFNLQIKKINDQNNSDANTKFFNSKILYIGQKENLKLINSTLQRLNLQSYFITGYIDSSDDFIIPTNSNSSSAELLFGRQCSIKSAIHSVIFDTIKLNQKSILKIKQTISYFENKSEKKSNFATIICGFYESEKIKNIKKYFELKNLQLVIQKGHLEGFGLIKKTKRLQILKDSDIVRALLNEIKMKFISDKKKGIQQDENKITDLVIVKSQEEKSKIVHLLESASIQCHVHESSFKYSSKGNYLIVKVLPMTLTVLVSEWSYQGIGLFVPSHTIEHS